MRLPAGYSSAQGVLCNGQRHATSASVVAVLQSDAAAAPVTCLTNVL